jgi:5'-3' exonuclease, N-terminal resolvase-like domain
VHTVIIDFSVLAHNLYANLKGCGVLIGGIREEPYTSILKAQLLQTMSLDWMGTLKPSEAQIVLVCDRKSKTYATLDGYPGYWRTQYLQRPEVVADIPRKRKADQGKPISYKGGRKYPEPGFTKLKEHLLKLCVQQKFSIVSVDGFEADDIAAAYCVLNARLPEDLQHDITLVTVDSDWVGLVSPKVRWFCMSGYFPRLRDDLVTINYWANKRLGVSVSNPSDIWDIKVNQGDKSDNLPPGSPIEVISLFQPPLEFRLWAIEEVYDLIQHDLLSPKVLSFPEAKVHQAIAYLNTLGVPKIIRDFNALEDTIQALEVNAA